MTSRSPITTDEVAAILHKARFRESQQLPCEPTRAIPPRSTGWHLHQDDHTAVQVFWTGAGARYRLGRLDAVSGALERAGFRVLGVADGRRTWLDVLGREADGEAVS
jgi:hypothetical protein